ncbi:permease [Prosthecomicrobium hirschii]|uniref:permease n=1 Tax=Prosthecodimorpha hirschii TaxID=665126 RepID=UPI00221E809A|nr:permease [Prosthecomicrobium hirschii]
MTRPGTLAWFAHHEMRLAWRDFVGMMTAGRPTRRRLVYAALAGFAAFLHLIAYAILVAGGRLPLILDRTTLVVATGLGAAAFALMLSQALESVTRAFYARGDLDLILSSPAAAGRLFAVRIGSVALATGAMTALLAGPFVNILAVFDRPGWLAAYPVMAAGGAVATGLAVTVTVGLIRLIGPRRTRFAAQVLAAVTGAAFVIGVQVGSILSFGHLDRTSFLASPAVTRAMPAETSLLYWPARAAAGETGPLAATLGLGALVLVGAILAFAGRFGALALTTAGSADPAAPAARGAAFRGPSSPAAALRRKEWRLVARDPWLLSQTLMQLLYLLPPAFLLWRNFGDRTGALVVLVPVLVMAAGQLAGGLAWLTISGEDAPDLVATAPVPAATATRAKAGAVIAAISVVLLPFSAAMAVSSPFEATMMAVFAAAAALSAIAIQLLFRMRARRSQFRRRQTASRFSTFAEAFSSIAWAGGAALAAAGTWLAAIPAGLALAVVAAAWLASPARDG